MRKKIERLKKMIWVLKRPNLTCVRLEFKPEEIPVFFS